MSEHVGEDAFGFGDENQDARQAFFDRYSPRQPKFIKVLRYDEPAVVSMLATLLALPGNQQIDTLAVVTRVFIEKRDHA